MRALFSFFILFFFIGYSCNGIAIQTEKERIQTEQNVKKNISIYITTVWNLNNVEALEGITGKDFVRTLNGIKVVASQNELKAHINVFTKGFPNLEVSLENVYLAEDNAFIKWNFTGLNSGVYGEYPPTDKKVRIGGISQITFNKEGVLTKEDTYFNELSLLQQLGYHLNPPDHKTNIN